MFLRILLLLIVFAAGIGIGFGICRHRHSKTIKLQCKILGVNDGWSGGSKYYYFKLQHPDKSIFLKAVCGDEYMAYKVGDIYTVTETKTEYDLPTEVITELLQGE